MKQHVVVILLVLCTAHLATAFFDRSLLTEKELEAWKVLKEECIVDSGVKREYVDDAEKGILVIDENLACFGACALKKIGIFNENGAADLDTAIAKIPETLNKERAGEVIRKCIKIENANVCLKAAMVIKCLMDSKQYVLTGEQ